MQRRGRIGRERGVERALKRLVLALLAAHQPQRLRAEFARGLGVGDNGGDLPGAGFQRVRDHDFDRDRFQRGIGEREQSVELRREHVVDAAGLDRARVAIHAVERRRLFPEAQAGQRFLAHRAVGGIVEGKREQPRGRLGRAEAEVGVERAAQDRLAARLRLQQRGERRQRGGNRALVVNRAHGLLDDEHIRILHEFADGRRGLAAEGDDAREAHGD